MNLCLRHVKINQYLKKTTLYIYIDINSMHFYFRVYEKIQPMYIKINCINVEGQTRPVNRTVAAETSALCRNFLQSLEVQNSEFSLPQEV